MTNFDWRKHKDLLNPDEEDPYSQNTFSEVSDKVGKEIASIFEDKTPDQALTKITDLLVDYHDKVINDDELQFIDFKQSKMIHGNDEHQIQRFTHLYPLLTDQLFAVDADHPGYLLLSVEPDTLIMPRSTKHVENMTIYYYPYPLSDVEVTDHGISGNQSSVSFVTKVYDEQVNILFEELIGWKTALDLEYDYIFIKPWSDR